MPIRRNQGLKLKCMCVIEMGRKCLNCLTQQISPLFFSSSNIISTGITVRLYYMYPPVETFSMYLHGLLVVNFSVHMLVYKLRKILDPGLTISWYLQIFYLLASSCYCIFCNCRMSS